MCDIECIKNKLQQMVDYVPNIPGYSKLIYCKGLNTPDCENEIRNISSNAITLYYNTLKDFSKCISDHFRSWLVLHQDEFRNNMCSKYRPFCVHSNLIKNNLINSSNASKLCNGMDIPQILNEYDNVISNGACDMMGIHMGSNMYDIASGDHSIEHCVLDDFREKILGPKIEVTLSTKNMISLCNAIAIRIKQVDDVLYNIYNKCDTNNLKAALMVLDIIRMIMCANAISIIDLATVAEYTNKEREVLTESGDYKDEDVDKYISSLNKFIREVRNFYEKCPGEVKAVIVPRKKTIRKMREYMRGALQRRYKLKIPMYIAASTEKDYTSLDKFINDEFINKLRFLDDEYPEYIVTTQKIDSGNIFVYVTLREPFGDEKDKYKRELDSGNEKADTITEAALTAKQRNNLEDYEFGLPKDKKYPLNDKNHIVKAIQYFHECEPKQKKLLANNIARRIIELDLVGEVRISENNPFKSYFPDWLSANKVEYDRVNNDYVIKVNGKVADKGKVKDYKKPVNESVILFDDNGELL